MSAEPSQSEPATRRVSLVTTVLNAAQGCSNMLESLAGQTRVPDEIVVVDGGSTDGTLDVIRQAAQTDDRIRLLVKPGANIGQGRNVGIQAATGEIILSTDSGCRLDRNWVESMIQPFEEHPDTELVAGTYEIDPQTLTEAVVGTATMRGALKPIDPDTYNPSCRSMAFTKELWERVGGFPDWIEIDDTLFNLKLRRMNVKRRLVRDASVHWRPRSTLAGIYRQFRFYATWRGHTQLDTEAIHFNIRNLTVCLMLLLASTRFTPIWALFAAALVYFYIYSFHGKASRVAAKLGTWKAYPLCIVVHWAIVLGGISGYLRASLQRLCDRKRYRHRMETYLAGT